LSRVNTRLSWLVVSVGLTLAVALFSSTVARANNVALEIVNMSSHELVLLDDRFMTGSWDHPPASPLAPFVPPAEPRSTLIELSFPQYSLVAVFYRFKYRSRTDPDSWVEIRQGSYGRNTAGVTANGKLTAKIQNDGWAGNVVPRRSVLIKDAT
jgi:hypothetical protein